MENNDAFFSKHSTPLRWSFLSRDFNLTASHEGLRFQIVGK